MTLYPTSTAIDRPVPRPTALREITVGVAALERSTVLYAEALGLETIRSGHIEPQAARLLGSSFDGVPAAVLTRPEIDDAPRIRLVETDAPTGRDPGNTVTPGPLGIGFTSSDIQAAHARLAAAGVSFFSPPIELTPEPEDPDEDHTGPRRFEAFGQTADGELVVLIERRNAPEPYGTLSERWPVSEPLHTSHVVADLAAASRFMSEALGHRMLFRETCQGEEFERLMGAPSGARFRFEMLQHPDHHIGRIIFIEYLEPSSAVAAGAAAIERGRGIRSLRYDTTDLEATLTAAEAAGAEIRVPPRSVRSAVLGSGRVAVVDSPLGVALEIWQPDSGGEQ